jgi:hypothetical protein
MSAGQQINKSTQNIPHDLTVYIRQPIAAALVFEGQPLVVDAE